VLCFTHLAQIADFADHHYLVEKRESRGRTVASVEEFDLRGACAKSAECFWEKR
jgi:DNA repair protein RecN (Recombination protein N)